MSAAALVAYGAENVAALRSGSRGLGGLAGALIVRDRTTQEWRLSA